MNRYNFDISSFFNNSTSANAFGSFNFGDYASIKNGSYGKLLKSYYAEQKKPISSDKTSTDKAMEKYRELMRPAYKAAGSLMRDDSVLYNDTNDFIKMYIRDILQLNQ